MGISQIDQFHFTSVIGEMKLVQCNNKHYPKTQSMSDSVTISAEAIRMLNDNIEVDERNSNES